MAEHLKEPNETMGEKSNPRGTRWLGLSVCCLASLVITAWYWEHTSWMTMVVGLALAVLLTLILHLIFRARESFRAAKYAHSQLSKEVGDRLLAQRKQDESERRLSEAFDKAAIGMVILSGEGTLQRVNRAFANMVRYEAADLNGRPLSELVLDDEVSTIADLIASMRDGNTPNIETEQRFRRHDGSIAYVRLHLTYMEAIGDGEAYLTGQVEDITAQKIAETKLRETLSLQQAILDSADRSIICTTPGGTIRIFNKAAERMLGYTAEEMVGKQTPAIIHSFEEVEAEAKELSAELGRTIQPGFEVFVARPREYCREEREWTYVRKDGSRFPVLLSVTACRNDEGKVFAFVGIANDITPQKNVEDALRSAKLAAEEASRAKSEFLASMSHEIRTPMNGIIGMTELALATDLDEDQRDLLNTIKESSDSLLTIINDILDFSKIEAGKMELDAVPFNLAHRLASTIHSLAVKAEQKRLEMLCEIDSDVPERVVGDPDRLRQVLTNLVGNAIKFTSAGEVAIRVRRHDVQDNDGHTTKLHFSVTDTGIGIPADKQQKIFEAFAQADSSTTRRYGGTGLGLSISARLVELMGGEIWVESQMGKGSTFHFTASFETASPPVELASSDGANRGSRGVVPTTHRLNLSTDGAEDDATLLEESPAHPARRLKILLAEDNPINQKLALRVLQGDCHEVAVANNGREVLSILDSRGEDFDLILMDVQMPEQDGLETTRCIRRRERGTGRHISIIALTAYAMKGDDQQCLAAGMDAYLSKPFRIEDLRSVIDAVLPSTSPDSMHTCDWNAAVEALDGEEEFLREIASLFIEDSPQWMREIRESIEQRDAHRLQSAAHRLKGSLLAFRATAATESAEQLEVMGRKGTLTSAKNVSRQLEQRMDDLLKDLEQKLAESVHADAGGPA